MNPPAYQKLPGRGTNAMEYHRLYQGADHLLLVASTGFSETYRRFYFSDIQGMIVRKTAVGAVQNGVLGAFIVFCLFGLASGGPGLAISWILGWSIPLSIFLGWLAANIARGPTCECDLRTAVQTRRLGCVGRLRTARQLRDRLRPLIEAAQGAVAPDDLRQRIDQARLEHAAAPPVIGGRPW